jgi:DNA invertase Pin-like site-specific DNA recombinase
MGDILGYARACTGDLDAAGQTARLYWAGAVQVFCDIRSERSMARPGLDRLLATARTGDAIAVARLDCLGRTMAEVFGAVATLKPRRLALVSLDEAIDTRSADGDSVLKLFAALACCEQRLAVERTQSGIAASCSGGKRRGRPPLDTDKITAALRLVESGLSPAAAARQLRLGRSTIYREVRRAGIERASSSERT